MARVNIFTWRAAIALSLCVCLALASGCGTGEYNRRAELRLKALQEGRGAPKPKPAANSAQGGGAPRTAGGSNSAVVVGATDGEKPEVVGAVSNTPNPSTPDFVVTTDQLSKEFTDDAASAETKYKGKLLAIEGPVLFNNTSLEKFSVTLFTPEARTFRMFECYLDKSLKNKLPKITSDAIMKLQGRCKGIEEDSKVGFSDCIFLGN